MAVKTYGVIHEAATYTELEQHLEELTIVGYTILKNVLNAEEVETARLKLDKVYQQQVEELGQEYLSSINELNLARCPLAYDEFFLSLATEEKILNIVNRLIGGSYVLLHLQNGIINIPREEHHQSTWHRDLPYQEFIISKPLAASALYCLDDFSVETGGTYVLPHTHRVEKIPSPQYIEKHQVSVGAPAGSVIVFDAMLFHRAGYNSSNRIRRAVNHVYVAPLLKQQINLPAILNGKYSNDPFLSKLLGYTSDVPTSVVQYRQNRHKKTHQRL
jgi:ectoine hydroxylase-related dioxygenase (phytanoyl-CoA dioxygenase family)